MVRAPGPSSWCCQHAPQQLHVSLESLRIGFSSYERDFMPDIREVPWLFQVLQVAGRHSNDSHLSTQILQIHCLL